MYQREREREINSLYVPGLNRLKKTIVDREKYVRVRDNTPEGGGTSGRWRWAAFEPVRPPRLLLFLTRIHPLIVFPP